MNKLRLLVFSGLLLVAASAPAPAPNSQLTNGPEIIEIIAPAGIAQETLESLNLGEPNAELSERNKRTIGILRQLFPGLSQTATADAKESDDDDSLVDAESQVNEVRVQFNEQPETKAEAKSDTSDQDSAASGGNNGAIDDLSLDDTDSDSTDENRNKRFLNFGGGDSSSGSGGGSGNFLFDIIRLIAGSGGTEQADESANTSDGESVGKGDGYTEGIPGPVTRLLILANRGLSNLVQDLILRLAQTSERIVNFKARLITSII